MAKYDTEDFLDNIKAVLIANLNTKLAAIDTAKTQDTLSLPQVQTAAYAFQGLNEEVINFDPFIIYGVESIATIPQLQGSATDITASVVLVLCENGKDEIDRLMLRYSRALKEVIEENYQSVGKGIKMLVSEFMPISFKFLNSDDSYKAVGININATIA